MNRVASAFLARVTYVDSGETSVALCLDAKEDIEIVETVVKVFKRMFGAQEHLDIIFISPAQKVSLEGVARPFIQEAATK